MGGTTNRRATKSPARPMTLTANLSMLSLSLPKAGHDKARNDAVARTPFFNCAHDKCQK